MVFFEGATHGGTWTRDLQNLCPALLKTRSHVYYSLCWSVVGYSPKNKKIKNISSVGLKQETVFLRQAHGETCVPAAAAGGDEPLWEETGRRVLVLKAFL